MKKIVFGIWLTILAAVILSGCLTSDYNLRAIKDNRVYNDELRMDWSSDSWISTHAKQWSSAGTIITHVDNVFSKERNTSIWIDKIIENGFLGKIYIELDIDNLFVSWGNNLKASEVEFKKEWYNNFITKKAYALDSSDKVLLNIPELSMYISADLTASQTAINTSAALFSSYIDSLNSWYDIDNSAVSFGVYFDAYDNDAWKPYTDNSTLLGNINADPLNLSKSIASYTSVEMQSFDNYYNAWIDAFADNNVDVIVSGNKFTEDYDSIGNLTSSKLATGEVIGYFFDDVNYTNVDSIITEAGYYRTAFNAASEEGSLHLIAGIKNNIYNTFNVTLGPDGTYPSNPQAYGNMVKKLISAGIYWTPGGDNSYWDYPETQPGDWWVRINNDAQWQVNPNNPTYASATVSPRKIYDAESVLYPTILTFNVGADTSVTAGEQPDTTYVTMAYSTDYNGDRPVITVNAFTSNPSTIVSSELKTITSTTWLADSTHTSDLSSLTPSTNHTLEFPSELAIWDTDSLVVTLSFESAIDGSFNLRKAEYIDYTPTEITVNHDGYIAGGFMQADLQYVLRDSSLYYGGIETYEDFAQQFDTYLFSMNLLSEAEEYSSMFVIDNLLAYNSDFVPEIYIYYAFMGMGTYGAETYQGVVKEEFSGLPYQLYHVNGTAADLGWGAVLMNPLGFEVAGADTTWWFEKYAEITTGFISHSTNYVDNLGIVLDWTEDFQVPWFENTDKPNYDFDNDGIPFSDDTYFSPGDATETTRPWGDITVEEAYQIANKRFFTEFYNRLPDVRLSMNGMWGWDTGDSRFDDLAKDQVAIDLMSGRLLERPRSEMTYSPPRKLSIYGKNWQGFLWNIIDLPTELSDNHDLPWSPIQWDFRENESDLTTEPATPLITNMGEGAALLGNQVAGYSYLDRTYSPARWSVALDDTAKTLNLGIPVGDVTVLGWGEAERQWTNGKVYLRWAGDYRTPIMYGWAVLNAAGDTLRSVGLDFIPTVDNAEIIVSYFDPFRDAYPKFIEVEHDNWDRLYAFSSNSKSATINYGSPDTPVDNGPTSTSGYLSFSGQATTWGGANNAGGIGDQRINLLYLGMDEVLTNNQYIQSAELVLTAGYDRWEFSTADTLYIVAITDSTTGPGNWLNLDGTSRFTTWNEPYPNGTWFNSPNEPDDWRLSDFGGPIVSYSADLSLAQDDTFVVDITTIAQAVSDDPDNYFGMALVAKWGSTPSNANVIEGPRLDSGTSNKIYIKMETNPTQLSLELEDPVYYTFTNEWASNINGASSTLAYYYNAKGGYGYYNTFWDSEADWVQAMANNDVIVLDQVWMDEAQKDISNPSHELYFNITDNIRQYNDDAVVAFYVNVSGSPFYFHDNDVGWRSRLAEALMREYDPDGAGPLSPRPFGILVSPVDGDTLTTQAFEAWHVRKHPDVADTMAYYFIEQMRTSTENVAWTGYYFDFFDITPSDWMFPTDAETDMDVDNDGIAYGSDSEELDLFQEFHVRLAQKVREGLEEIRPYGDYVLYANGAGSFGPTTNYYNEYIHGGFVERANEPPAAGGSSWPNSTTEWLRWANDLQSEYEQGRITPVNFLEFSHISVANYNATPAFSETRYQMSEDIFYTTEALSLIGPSMVQSYSPVFKLNHDPGRGTWSPTQSRRTLDGRLGIDVGEIDGDATITDLDGTYGLLERTRSNGVTAKVVVKIDNINTTEFAPWPYLILDSKGDTVSVNQEFRDLFE